MSPPADVTAALEALVKERLDSLVPRAGSRRPEDAELACFDDAQARACARPGGAV